MNDHEYRSLVCLGCGHKHPVPVFCGDRFCIVCGKYRRARTRTRLAYLLKHASYPPGYGPKFITLTIPNVSDLKAGVKLIQAAYRRLRSYSAWRNYVDGGASVIEVTGTDGAWHVHIHAVISARYFPQPLLSKLWRRASGGFIVWIQRIPHHAAIAYLSKYMSKSVCPPDQRLTISDALKGTRLFTPTGSWYHLRAPKIKHPFPCPKCGRTDWLPDGDMFAAWIRSCALAP